LLKKQKTPSVDYKSTYFCLNLAGYNSLINKQTFKYMKQLKLYLSFIFAFFILKSYTQCNQLDAGPDVTVDCSNNVTTLTATTFPGIGSATDTYRVEAATPCPLPPSGSTILTGISSDDVWSRVITLPFTFYYFGQPYSQILIGANGVLTFDVNRTSPQTQQPGGFCEWSFNSPLPNSTDMFRNTIFGAYHDVDVNFGGTIQYYVSGTYPQRKFVVSYDNVAHYSCNNMRTTQRIVLYETSNVIDVQIDRKDTCTSWNNGNALVGIQNQAGDVAFVPPGRNTGPWTIPASSPELWRFIPDHNPQTIVFNFTWYEDATNTVIGTGASVTVAPTQDTVYRVEATYNDPNNGQNYTLTDTVTVFFNDNLSHPDLGLDIQDCAGNTVTLDGTTNNAVSYQWQKDGVDIPGATNPTLDVTQTGTYTIIVTNGVCSKSDDVYVGIEQAPTVDLGADFHECEHNTAVLVPQISNLNGNETYQWQKDGVDIPGATAPTLDVTETGNYTLNVTNSIGCVGTDDVLVTFDEYPDLDLGTDQVVCSYDDAIIQANITDADSYMWTVNGQIHSNSTDTLILNGSGNYDVELTINRGVCTVSDTININILDPLIITATPILYGELQVEAQGGLPPYQYSVDGISYNQLGYFQDLPNGDYPVFVTDANNCVYEFPPVHVINLVFPKFITPNGDGYNDTWRVENAENTPAAQLRIYDRYGKLIKQMTANIYEFWDGTYNGKPLISSDYWYVLILPNGKVYKGHFALKR